MSLVRLLFAILRIGYLPKIGVRYEYTTDGPFGAVLIPQEVQRGYVRYDVHHVHLKGFNIVTTHSTSFSTWALMCRECKPS